VEFETIDGASEFNSSCLNVSSANVGTSWAPLTGGEVTGLTPVSVLCAILGEASIIA